MEYKHIVEGRFIERPNRFIARVEIESTEETRENGETGKEKLRFLGCFRGTMSIVGRFRM